MFWNVTTYFSVMIESSSAVPLIPTSVDNPAAVRSALRLSSAVVASPVW